MILSILGSRSRRAANEQARTELDEVMDRVTAVALAHHLLTIESGQSVVDAADPPLLLCCSVGVLAKRTGARKGGAQRGDGRSWRPDSQASILRPVLFKL